MNKITPACTTRDEYTKITALNYSGMKELLRSPLHYKSSLTRPQDESKALRVGSMVHLAVLQPDLWGNYIQGPECDRRTKEGKEMYAAFLGALKPTQIMTDRDEHELVTNVSESVHTLLENIGVKFQHTELMLTAEYAGVPLKCSLDAIGDDGYIYDIKTCEDASPEAFKRNVYNYKYYLQAYVYSFILEAVTGQRTKGFRFIATEKEDPYCSAIYDLGVEFQTKAIKDFEQCINLYKLCSGLDAWPGYNHQVVTLDLQPKLPAPAPITFA